LMKQAMDVGPTPKFGTGIADQVNVELHSQVSYPTLVYIAGPVDLSTSGIITVNNLPSWLIGDYYITIKHRNSIETTTPSPVWFGGGSVIDWDFTTSNAQAYGNNLKLMGSTYAIWGGDVTQDGFVDGSDMAAVDNASTAVLHGYNPQDVNGDGIVDGTDMATVDNNSTGLVHSVLP
jgi:hypothetical protein